MKKTALSSSQRIGSLDRVITFRVMTETQDATGFPVSSWADDFTDFAALEYLTATESYSADMQISINRVVFTTRNNANTRTATTKHRILLDSKEYDIEGISEHGGRLRFLKFNCKLRA